MPWLFDLLMQGSLVNEWTSRDWGANETWKVSDCIEGID